MSEEPEAPPARSGPSKVQWAGIAALVAAVGAWVVLVPSGGGGDSESDPDRYDAERVCKEEFIPKRLKSPGSAEYDLQVTGGPVTYVVSGTVDSENGFGALIRNDVTCKVTIDGDQWRLESVTGLVN